MSKAKQINPHASTQDRLSIKAESFVLWQSLSELLSFFAFLNEPSIHQNTAAYLRFGAAKRIRWILEDVRWLTSNIPVDRTEALTDEECHAAGLHLNSVYLHIRGTLDNFAWSLLWQFAPVEAEQLDKDGNYNQIGLFRTSVLRHLPTNSRLKTIIESLRDWNDAFRLRRDPVAHRLPLRLIPQVITGAENIRSYQETQATLFANISDFAQRCTQNSNRVDDDSIRGITERCNQIEKLADEHEAKQQKLCRQMESLGTFVPVFTCSLAGTDLIPLYPTITDDCGNLIKIGAELRTFIESVVRPSSAPQSAGDMPVICF